jgi:methyl-accepting chemotaxis protein
MGERRDSPVPAGQRAVQAGASARLQLLPIRRVDAENGTLATQLDVIFSAQNKVSLPAALSAIGMIQFVGDGFDAANSAIIVVLLAGLALIHFLSRRRNLEPAHQLARTYQFMALTALQSLCWSFVVVRIAAGADAGVLIMIPCFLVALTALGGLTYAAIPLVSLIYIATICVATEISLVIAADGLPWLFHVLLIVFGVVLMDSILSQAALLRASSARASALLAAERARADAEAERAQLEARQAAERARLDEERVQAANQALSERARMESARKEEMTSLAVHFESSVLSISTAFAAAIEELEGSSAALAAFASQTGNEASIVSGRATATAAIVGEVATSAAELGAAVGDMDRRIAAQSAHNATAAQSTQDAEAAMRALVEDARNVGSIVSAIAGFAGQTNLLALNATIEAARAGESGRGFAVVASEVKALADQVQNATSDINSKLGAIESGIARAAACLNRVAADVSGVGNIATEVAAGIAQQRTAVHQIDRNAQVAAVDVSAVEQSIAVVATVAHEADALTQRVNTAAASLAKHADHLRTATEDFLTRLNAA